MYKYLQVQSYRCQCGNSWTHSQMWTGGGNAGGYSIAVSPRDDHLQPQYLLSGAPQLVAGCYRCLHSLPTREEMDSLITKRHSGVRESKRETTTETPRVKGTFNLLED